MIRFWTTVVAALWSGAALAASLPVYAPPAAWVKPAAIPQPPAVAPDAIFQVLLSDRQMYFGPDGDEFYSESAVRILKPAGLALVNQLAPSWNPETDTLTFHRFNVIRGGLVIDLLGGGKKVTVIRRETNLELAMLDGDLTAVIQPEGLQIGDTIDFAFTIQRSDPVMKGYSQGADALRHLGIASHVRLRAVWPASKPMRWIVTDGLPQPKITRTADASELTIELDDVEAPKPPVNAPGRFDDLAELQLTQFRDWAEVSALMAPLYAKADMLAANSTLRAEAQKIAAASSDPKVRAAAALRLVQDQVRYAFVGMNLGGLTPADADVTWMRRFGDCKGKTALLLALLHQLGIAAEPSLVSTQAGDGLDQRLPTVQFDHVIARAEIDGKVYWLDGTRSGDRALDDIQIPSFHWTLPVQKSGGQLEKLTPPPLAEPAFETMMRLDATAGLDAPAAAHVEHVLRGDVAVELNQQMISGSHQDADRSMRQYWRQALPWIEPTRVEFSFDDAHRAMRLTMEGAGKMDWTGGPGDRQFQIADSYLGYDASFKREPGPHADAPFAVGYPTYSKSTAIIVLPGKGDGFGLLQAGDVDQSVGGVRYQRRTRIEGGVVTMVASSQAVAPEFPAAEGVSAAAALRRLSDYDVVVTGPSAAATPPTQEVDLGPPPTDATGFGRRAAAYLAQGDPPHAISDLDQAIKLAPTAAKYVYDRGVAHFESHQDDLAMSDFNRALLIDPADSFALEARGQLQLFRGRVEEAKADFAAAAKLAPSDTDRLWREATAFEATGRFDDSVAVLDRLIALSPKAKFFNSRCWTQAETGRRLDAALADCNAALKLEPGLSAALDSRGFVELRLKRLDASIADYEAALKVMPGEMASLYGRGLGELRKGDKQHGQADIDEARRVQPGVGDTFKRAGISP
ncbi:MAG TPA: DUF3857 domain-containing protein [Caulobacteraceae bacterium]